jgi:PQQ-like domain
VRRLALTTTLILGAVLVSSALARLPGAGSVRHDWRSYAGDRQLSNAATFGLTVGAAGRLTERWRAQLDGPIVASALYARDISTPDGSRNLVYAATEAGSVYALAADSGEVVWQRRFGTVTPVPLDESYCGTWGISSTPLLDREHHALFVATAAGRLEGLDPATGADVEGWPLTLTERPTYEYVWGGLRRLGDRLYVAFASHCDEKDESGQGVDGRIVLVDLAAQRIARTFDPVEGPGNMAGAWGWGGVSVSPGGDAVYTAFGNSYVYDPACDCYSDNAGLGNSVVRLTPDLELVESNRPGDIPDSGDHDFGAAPLLFQPIGCPPLAAANNKNGMLYVWRAERLRAGPIWRIQLALDGSAFVGQPSWSARHQLFFDAGTRIMRNGMYVGDGVTAFRVRPRCRFTRVWSTVTGTATQPPPLVVGEVLFAVGGAEPQYTVLSAATGRVLKRFPAGEATFAPPSGADGLIAAGDYAGVLHVFSAD